MRLYIFNSFKFGSTRGDRISIPQSITQNNVQLCANHIPLVITWVASVYIWIFVFLWGPPLGTGQDLQYSQQAQSTADSEHLVPGHRSVDQTPQDRNRNWRSNFLRVREGGDSVGMEFLDIRQWYNGRFSFKFKIADAVEFNEYWSHI